MRCMVLLKLFQLAGTVQVVPEVSKAARCVAPLMKAIPALLPKLVLFAPAYTR